MTASRSFDVDMQKVLESSRYAPSVHNAQPWLVNLGNKSLEIRVDDQHALIYGDPTGRQTIISLGIFTEAVLSVAKERGWSAYHLSFMEGLVILKFKETRTNKQLHASTLLKRRSSDRSIFKPIQLSKQDMRAIKRNRVSKTVQVEITTDKEIISKIAELTSKAVGVALSTPEFRNELVEHLVLPWSSRKRGISVESLYIPWYLALSQPLLLRLGIGLGSETKLELQRWLSATAVVLITARGDMSQFWFDVGRTYLRVSMSLEELGYSQATSAAIVEASNYHEDIEKLLHTKSRILAILRIGSGKEIRHHSPRVAVSDLLH